MALNNGATVEEIQQALLHASICCDVALAVEAFRGVAEVIDAPTKAWIEIQRLASAVSMLLF